MTRPSQEPTARHAPALAPLVADIDVEALADRLTEVMLDQVYSEVVDPTELRTPLSDATHEKVGCLFALISGTMTLDDMRPAASLAFASRVGRLGVSEQTFERSYRVGQEALWEWWMTVVEEHCAACGGSVPQFLRPSIPLLFGFVDRMLFLSLAEYHRAVAERSQTREHRRTRLLEQLLAGALEVPGADTERFIGYTFGRWHLCLVLDRGERAADRRLAEDLRAASGAPRLLVLERPSASTTVWLGFDGPPSAASAGALSAAMRGSGRSVAVGQPRSGLAGFRATHAEALDVARVRAAGPHSHEGVTWARDVGIEVLAIRDPTAARALVETELGPALRGGLLTDRVRETLEAWIVTGSNVGAASRLGVHEQTVRNRLRRVEDALGHGLLGRRTELHVALRLSRLDLSDADAPVHAGRPG